MGRENSNLSCCYGLLKPKPSNCLLRLSSKEQNVVKVTRNDDKELVHRQQMLRTCPVREDE
jgi:hypothetical protein